jgi:aminopeptidase N
MRKRLCGAITLFALLLLNPPLLAQPLVPGAQWDALHYQAQIEPDLASGSVTGSVTIRAVPLQAGLTSFQLNAGALEVSSVTENGRPLKFQKTVSVLKITLAAASLTGQPRTIAVSYHGAPKSGITFLPAAAQVYTAFSTSQWMPCIDAPADRASLRLTVTVPAHYQVVGNGRLLREINVGSGKKRSEWQQDEAVPSYTYGFVAGEFREVLDSTAKPVLRYLVPEQFSEEQTRQIFRETRGMIRFYEEKAGVRYPGSAYTQVLVSGRAAQEMSGFAVMGASYGQRVLADETQVWLGAHEASHQWWGNAVTNRDWNEFWLNEGIASFMNAAYFEQRFGREQYAKHIDGARAKFEALVAEGKDKPLVFADWKNPSAADRSIAYDKGAYVMHLLRGQLGDDAFWLGLRRYTQKHWGKSVTSRDVQEAMQQASGKDLTAFFAQWVYPKSE